LHLIRIGAYEEALHELKKCAESSGSGVGGGVDMETPQSPRDMVFLIVRRRFFSAIRDDMPALAAPYAVLYVALDADPHEVTQYIHVQSHTLWSKRFEPLLTQLLAKWHLTTSTTTLSTADNDSSDPSPSSCVSLSLLAARDPQVIIMRTNTQQQHLTPHLPRLPPLSPQLTPAIILSQLYTAVSEYQLMHTYIGDTLGVQEALWLMAHAQPFVAHTALFILHALKVAAQLDVLASSPLSSSSSSSKRSEEMVTKEEDHLFMSGGPTSLTDFLDELTLISQHTELYRLFLRKFFEVLQRSRSLNM
jgi:hypothetical protein